MFSAYPGFEELSVRVEVEWQEGVRAVIARIKRWPVANRAVVVCTFEDFEDEAESEWIVFDSDRLYQLKSPCKLLCRNIVYDVATRAPRHQRGWSERGRSRIRSVVRRAFEFETFNIAPLYDLPELPAEPRAIVHQAGALQWCGGERGDQLTHINWLESFAGHGPTLHAQLRREWRDEASDVRFSWRWAQMSEPERRFRLTGNRGDWDEAARVMRWVLLGASRLWRKGESWSWCLDTEEFGSYLICNGDNFDEDEEESLQAWSAFLSNHYAPCVDKKLNQVHGCVGNSSRAMGSELGHIQISRAPTAHEQIEARLALRDWLRDKTTPQRARELLASLAA